MIQQVAPRQGFAFHLHHDVLAEWCNDYEERVDYIKTNKPKAEQEPRLRLFKLIPPDRIPLPLQKAGAAYNKSLAALNKARAACEPELKTLHQELCPGCPWDEWSIFPKEKA